MTEPQRYSPVDGAPVPDPTFDHPVRTPTLDALRAENEQLREQVEQIRGIGVASLQALIEARSELNALRDGVESIVTDWGAGTVHQPTHAAYARLRALLATPPDPQAADTPSADPDAWCQPGPNPHAGSES